MHKRQVSTLLNLLTRQEGNQLEMHGWWLKCEKEAYVLNSYLLYLMANVNLSVAKSSNGVK